MNMYRRIKMSALTNRRRLPNYGKMIYKLCPAGSAGVLNLLIRKIVFVRASVRAYVRPSVCTPFPYCDFATCWAKRVIWKSTILDENTRFCGSFLIWKSTMLDEHTWFCGLFSIWKSMILDKLRDFAVYFLFENWRFWTKKRDFAAYSYLKISFS